MAYVYRHIRLDKNEPFYIGIGRDNKFTRANTKRGRNNLWNKISKKTDYEVEILFSDVDINFAKDKEREFIKLYGRIDSKTGILSNLTEGGDGLSGYKLREETKEKLRQYKGVKHHMFGKKMPESQRLHISQAKIGEKNPNYGKKPSLKTLELMRINSSGKNNPMYGVRHPKEIIEIIKEKKRGRFVGANCPTAKRVIDTNTGVIYGCLKDVSDSFGINYNTLSHYLIGYRKNKTSFKYLNDLD